MASKHKGDPARAAAGKGRAASADVEGALTPHETALQQFRIIFNAVKTHFQQVERKVGVGGAQVWALSVIRERPGIGVGELAAVLNVRQPTASIIVRNLVQQGFAQALREGADKRSVQLHITAEGRKVLRRAPGPFSGVLPEALQALDPDSLALLNQGLTQLISLLDADVRAAKTPLSGLGT